jgi:uncharacterized protein YifE (UPF0438 family)
MSTDIEKAQLEYLKKMGKFRVDRNHKILKSHELDELEKYGHLFEALSSGRLQPANPKQEQFIEVARLKKKPETFYEWIWFKYIRRKDIEAKKGHILDMNPMPDDDTFCSREMSKEVKNMMFKVTKENHNKYK